MPRRTTVALAGAAAVLLAGLGWSWTRLVQSGSARLPEPPVGVVRDLTWGSGNDAPHEVVLRGRILDPTGQPFANSSVFLVPAYMGSGPARIEARTDEKGYFAFPRFLLARFELVPRSLEDWRPGTPGQYLRIVQTLEAWLSTAEAGRDLELHVQAYTLVPVTLDISAYRAKYIQVWTTRGGVLESGMSYPATHSRVTLALEEGVPIEVWAHPRNDQNFASPLRLGNIRPLWSGTPAGPVTIPPPR